MIWFSPRKLGPTRLQGQMLRTEWRGQGQLQAAFPLNINLIGQFSRMA